MGTVVGVTRRATGDHTYTESETPSMSADPGVVVVPGEVLAATDEPAPTPAESPADTSPVFPVLLSLIDTAVAFAALDVADVTALCDTLGNPGYHPAAIRAFLLEHTADEYAREWGHAADVRARVRTHTGADDDLIAPVVEKLAICHAALGDTDPPPAVLVCQARAAIAYLTGVAAVLTSLSQD